MIQQLLARLKVISWLKINKMSFSRYFDAETQYLTPLFTAAERADREFRQAWKEGLARLGTDRYKQTERCRETLERFHDTRQIIDEIVSTVLAEAKRGDFAQLPRLFAYIALPGRYFRSGYQRAAIWRFLKQLPLSA